MFQLQNPPPVHVAAAKKQIIVHYCPGFGARRRIRKGNTLVLVQKIPIFGLSGSGHDHGHPNCASPNLAPRPAPGLPRPGMLLPRAALFPKARRSPGRRAAHAAAKTAAMGLRGLRRRRSEVAWWLTAPDGCGCGPSRAGLGLHLLYLR